MNGLNIIQLAVLAPAFSLFCQDVFWTQHMTIKGCPKGKCVRSKVTRIIVPLETNTLGLEYPLPSVLFRYANHLRLCQHSAEHIYAYCLTVSSPALLSQLTSKPQDHPPAPPDNGFTSGFLCRASDRSEDDLAWTGNDGMYAVTKGNNDSVGQFGYIVYLNRSR